MEEKAYEIYTDASFDHQAKIGTYAIAITQGGKVIKTIARQCDKKLSKKGCSFRLKWVPRGSNKIAHKYSHSIFQKLKKTNDSRNVIVIDKKSFIEILKKFNKNQCDVILYLFDISNEKNLIVNTQNAIAESLQISSSTINSIFQGLIKLSMLVKIQKGMYSLLV